MYYLQFLLVCFCYLFVSYNAAAVSSFIDKCLHNDKVCLKRSSQKALPYFTAGLPEYGLPPLDPLHIDKTNLNVAGLILDVDDINISGTSKCEILDVERNIIEKWLKFSCACPIQATGKYSAGGELISIPIEGKGPFRIDIDKIHINAKIDLDIIKGKDDQRYWTINKYQYNLDIKGAAKINFDNLFNGDQNKAGPVMAIINQNGNILVQSIGKPLIDKLVHDVVKDVKKFTKKVPASELELLN